MLGYIILIIYALGTVIAALNGTAEAAGKAVLDGAQEAIAFAISIGGAICLWSGVLQLMEESGISQKLSLALKPILIKLFPISSKDAATLSALAENVSANVLGLGNAATPAGIRAAKSMAKIGDKKAADELCLFVVINTASIQLLPSTIAAVRAAKGAAVPFDITPAVWLSSIISLLIGLMAASVFKRLWK